MAAAERDRRLPGLGAARLPMAAAAEGGRVRGERRGAGTRPARPPSPPAAPAPPPLPHGPGLPRTSPFVAPGTAIPLRDARVSAPERRHGNRDLLALQSPPQPSGQRGPGAEALICHVTKEALRFHGNFSASGCPTAQCPLKQDLPSPRVHLGETNRCQIFPPYPSCMQP
ncbi:mitogen-activated protein kinase 7-like isoform X2 [Oenanthe melanoleuca]|uniref:mitogen-activated protein kinase 7-like isoform X2 n=1 Tax=Oenanthe melanoleuca TaxID=2939378 RepID=UPI0024C1B539|nr:mitogen-activated protein kinase 7-like isoform X2 [Oenanthe melanoleuca]